MTQKHDCKAWSRRRPAKQREGMMELVRVQRKRTKGWKMPENTVYVGRPTKWGNRYTVAEMGSHEEAVCKFEEMLVEGFEDSYPMEDEIIRELKGKNLACFCPLDKPCHADVLLKIANIGEVK